MEPKWTRMEPENRPENIKIFPVQTQLEPETTTAACRFWSDLSLNGGICVWIRRAGLRSRAHHSAHGDRHGGNYRSPIGSISCDAAFGLYHSANDERIIVVLGVIHGNDLQNCLPSVLGFHDSKVHM